MAKRTSSSKPSSSNSSSFSPCFELKTYYAESEGDNLIFPVFQLITKCSICGKTEDISMNYSGIISYMESTEYDYSKIIDQFECYQILVNHLFISGWTKTSNHLRLRMPETGILYHFSENMLICPKCSTKLKHSLVSDKVPQAD